MSTKQSAYFKGLARVQMPSPFKVGDGHTVLATHVFTEDVLTTDVLELIPLPPGCRVTGIDFVTENIGAININIGFMSGVSGDAVSVRTCGAEFFSAAAANTPAAAALLSLINAGIASGEIRSIGLVPAANITLGATKKIHTRLQYTA
ncbi:MAG: hypothetical protein Q8K33_01540 [Cypionkella sp.]|uniref:hypothetical protein n=1 Tax=Cypionkella sp. TaxID=2811411 RepID=UPI00272F1489|nr:hypothetical protein [Cypionkella sp.]MDP2047564.1 hypothetical protein [Cypionkella sp.]